MQKRSQHCLKFELLMMSYMSNYYLVALALSMTSAEPVPFYGDDVLIQHDHQMKTMPTQAFWSSYDHALNVEAVAAKSLTWDDVNRNILKLVLASSQISLARALFHNFVPLLISIYLP